MKLPAIQFYPADWRKDPGVQSLSYHDRGVWFEILCLMHESEQRGMLLLNGKPMPPDALGRLLGLSKVSLARTLTTLLDLGVMSRDDAGTFFNRRMTRDERLRQVRQEAGKLGGNPVLVNRAPKQTSTKPVGEDNQSPTPSVSSSSSLSTSKAEEASREKKPRALPKLADDEYLDELQKRKPYLLVNVRNVFEKMEVWCETKGVQPTRKRLLNWLNTEQRPMAATNGNKAPPVDDDCRDCRNTGLIKVADPLRGYEEFTQQCKCEYGTRRSAELQTNRTCDDDHRAA